MLINRLMAGRLKSLCRRSVLQDPIEQFLEVWTDHDTSLDVCSDVLKWLCRRLDDHGEYHEAEVLIMEGEALLARERNRRRDSVRAIAIVVVGGVLGFGLGLLTGGRRAA